MRSPAQRRRFIVTSVLFVGLLGLTIPIALAQTRPGSAPATGAVASPAGLRERLAGRIEELSKRIEERLELQRQAERADAALARLERVATGGPGVDAIAPGLVNDQYQLRQLEIQRDLLADQYGSQHPRYKAIVQRVAAMQEAYDRRLKGAQGKAASELDAARTDAATTQKKLEIAVSNVEAAKRELIDSAAPAAVEQPKH
jgi:hypothetical protein